MIRIANTSGGRTSCGPLIKAMKDNFDENEVDYVFCDTGCEDKDTYRFIRDCEKYFGIKITCLKLILSKEKGVGLIISFVQQMILSKICSRGNRYLQNTEIHLCPVASFARRR